MGRVSRMGRVGRMSRMGWISEDGDGSNAELAVVLGW